MNIKEAKKIIKKIEPELEFEIYIIAHIFNREGRKLHLALTERLRKITKKDKVWLSNEFLSSFKNGERGYDPEDPRSPGGKDGIFLIDNINTSKDKVMVAMVKKIYDNYIDKKDSGIDQVVSKLDIKKKDIKAVRLVSHHMRLLGVLKHREKEDWLVLVDYDNTGKKN